MHNFRDGRPNEIYYKKGNDERLLKAERPEISINKDSTKKNIRNKIQLVYAIICAYKNARYLVRIYTQPSVSKKVPYCFFDAGKMLHSV